METRSDHPQDAAAAAEVRILIEEFAAAARRVDQSWLAEHYAPAIRAFDAILALEFRGRDAYLEHWRQCMEMCPGAMIFDLHGLEVDACGDLAVGHSLIRCGAVAPDGKEQAGWMRCTQVWSRRDGRWRIAHEHFSAPFDPQTMQIMADAKP